MRHAKGYSAYAKQDRLRRHAVDLYLIDGKPVCICCTYPLAGRFYRIKVPFAYLAKLLKEIRNWGISHTLYMVDKDAVVTGDPNVIDVANEAFINRLDLIEIKLL